MKLKMVASQRQPQSSGRVRSTVGFTIIEVLIVLAVAGLILLIVFEAIPTLTRSGRNNQRKQDVQTILEAVSHNELNNSGNIPILSNDFLQYYKQDITYYNTSSVKYIPVPDATPTTNGINVYADAAGNPSNAGPETSSEIVDIYNYQKCAIGSQGKSTSTGAGYNDIVALYSLESSSSVTVPQCQQL
jgi:prepilin-type N-terminal cleavage/methylation domain-containing protein